MAKKVFAMYLAKEGNPNSDAYAKLDLPASPWELWDALDKVRLQTDDILYMEIEDYYAFEHLAPHLDGLEISLNELNDLAELLSALDEVQEVAFDGFLRMEVQNKVNTNGGVITLQDLRDLAVSAKTDCYHVVDAADDAQLGRFYAENEFVPELDGISDEVFEMLDFAGIGRMMRCSENGVFVGSLYVLQDGELTTAPSVQKTLPEKPGYLFRLTLGLHPDIGGNRTTELDLPASEEALAAAQEQLGTLNWENTVVLNYDGILPNAAFFADLPSELEAFNEFAKAVQDMSSPEKQLPKLKALLEQFEVQDIATAISLTECLDDYVLTPEISSPQETAIDQLHFMTDDHSVELLLSHVNLYAYGCDLIKEDNAVLSPYPKISTKEENSMKFNLNHDPNNKTLAIPRAALQLSGLAGVSDLILHTDSGCILLLPGDPTVAELLKTISLISTVTPQLISRLAERSQMAMEAGMTETACGACEHEPHCSGLEIPPCQLAEAGISPNAALESFVEDGKVIVQAAEKTAADVLIDELDDDVRTMLEDSGVQLEGVCRLLEKEDISG